VDVGMGGDVCVCLCVCMCMCMTSALKKCKLGWPAARPHTFSFLPPYINTHNTHTHTCLQTHTYAQALMSGLRGSNMDESDFALTTTKMNLMEVGALGMTRSRPEMTLLGICAVLCMYGDQSERISWKEASGAFDAFRS